MLFRFFLYLNFWVLLTSCHHSTVFDEAGIKWYQLASKSSIWLPWCPLQSSNTILIFPHRGALSQRKNYRVPSRVKFNAWDIFFEARLKMSPSSRQYFLSFFWLNREDADKAVTAHLSLAQRKLFISYSRRKDPRKKEKPKKDEDEENGFEIVKSTETETKDTKDETTGEDVVKQLDQSKAGEGKHEERKGRRNPRGKGREGEPGGEGKVGRLIIRNLAFQVRLKVNKERSDRLLRTTSLFMQFVYGFW